MFNRRAHDRHRFAGLAPESGSRSLALSWIAAFRISTVDLFRRSWMREFTLCLFVFYALAKELKIDNKVLVDLCTKAGITGKGSALASLSDEETEKLKAFLSAGKGAKTGGGAARANPSRYNRRCFTPRRLSGPHRHPFR